MDILLVDDSAADAYLTKLALIEALPDIHVRVAEDGEQALRFLSETEQYPSMTHPDLILLDLNMPRLDGFSFLMRMKALPEHESTPVIILTTSSWSRDVERAYELGALKYFTKPGNWEDYMALGTAIAAVWHQWQVQSGNTEDEIAH